MHTVV